jgi:DNA-binding GntR family transcriptional regulator
MVACLTPGLKKPASDDDVGFRLPLKHAHWGTTMPVTTNGGALKCDRGLRRQTIVESLLADVFQGRLRAGGHLVTQELARRFGVSHTPIREALIALAGIGIIDLLPNRGAVVRRVTPNDVHEVCQVRKVLECAATRRACGRIDLAELHTLAADLKRMQKIRHRGGPRFLEEARAVDSKLHDLVAESCGNRFLANELARLKILFRAFRDVSWEHDEARNDYHRLTEEASEHLAVVEALLAGDARRAARFMARHIRSGARYWSRALPKGTPARASTNSPSPGRNGSHRR